MFKKLTGSQTTDTDTEQAYEENFAYFAGFSRGVANAR